MSKDNKHSICPVCGSNKVIEIMYGLPTKEGIEEYKKGNIELGGCTIIGGEPNRKCKNCGSTWEEIELTFKEKVQLYKEERKGCKGIIEKIKLICEIF